MYTAFHNARNYTDDLPKLTNGAGELTVPEPTHIHVEESSRIKWKGPSPKPSPLSFWGEPVSVSKKTIFHDENNRILPALTDQHVSMSSIQVGSSIGTSSPARNIAIAARVVRDDELGSASGGGIAVFVPARQPPHVRTASRDRFHHDTHIPGPPRPATEPSRRTALRSVLLETICGSNGAHEPRSMDLWLDSYGRTTSVTKCQLQADSVCPHRLAAALPSRGAAPLAETAPHSPVKSSRWTLHSTRTVARHYALQAALDSLRAAGLAPAVACN